MWRRPTFILTDQALEVNVKAPLLLAQQAVASMRARAGGGAVIAIGTKAARPLVGPPYPDTPPVRAGSLYGGTMAALHRITQSIAAESDYWVLHGIGFGHYGAKAWTERVPSAKFRVGPTKASWQGASLRSLAPHWDSALWKSR